jgi:hypothetical protein
MYGFFYINLHAAANNLVITSYNTTLPNMQHFLYVKVFFSCSAIAEERSIDKNIQVTRRMAELMRGI